MTVKCLGKLRDSTAEDQNGATCMNEGETERRDTATGPMNEEVRERVGWVMEPLDLIRERNSSYPHPRIQHGLIVIFKHPHGNALNLPGLIR